MSQAKITTAPRPSATVLSLDEHNRLTSAELFDAMGRDWRAGQNVWRECSLAFARYCNEVMPPVLGPEGSGSYAVGECFHHTKTGAIHCVIAPNGDTFWAKYVCLMDWADELLALREALS